MVWKRDMTSFHRLVHLDQVLSVVVVGTWYRKMDRTGHLTSMMSHHDWIFICDWRCCGDSLSFIHILTYISSSFNINENIWTSNHFIKIKDWASTNTLGLLRSSTSSMSWIFEVLVSVHGLPKLKRPFCRSLFKDKKRGIENNEVENKARKINLQYKEVLEKWTCTFSWR